MHRQAKETAIPAEVRKAKRFIDIAFVISLCLALVLILFLFHLHCSTTFSAKRWKNQQEHRYGMLPQLLGEHRLYQMHKDELIALLGYDQHKWDSNRADQLTYYLGLDPITQKENWLMINLHSNRVASYYIYSE